MNDWSRLSKYGLFAVVCCFISFIHLLLLLFFVSCVFLFKRRFWVSLNLPITCFHRHNFCSVDTIFFSTLYSAYISSKLICRVNWCNFFLCLFLYSFPGKDISNNRSAVKRTTTRITEIVEQRENEKQVGRSGIWDKWQAFETWFRWETDRERERRQRENKAAAIQKREYGQLRCRVSGTQYKEHKTNIVQRENKIPYLWDFFFVCSVVFTTYHLDVCESKESLRTNNNIRLTLFSPPNRLPILIHINIIVSLIQKE